MFKKIKLLNVVKLKIEDYDGLLNQERLKVNMLQLSKSRLQTCHLKGKNIYLGIISWKPYKLKLKLSFESAILCPITWKVFIANKALFIFCTNV